MQISKSLENLAIEQALPGHMMYLMAQSTITKGFVMRQDVLHKLNVSAAAPLALLKADMKAVSRAAKRVEEYSRSLLFDLSPDDPVHGLYACAMFALTLVDEQKLLDNQIMAVLVALLLMDDLKAEGGVEHYTFKEQILRAEAYKLMQKALKKGLYTNPMITPDTGDKKAIN